MFFYEANSRQSARAKQELKEAKDTPQQKVEGPSLANCQHKRKEQKWQELECCKFISFQPLVPSLGFEVEISASRDSIAIHWCTHVAFERCCILDMSTFYGFTHGMRPRMTLYCLVGILFALAFHEPTISSSLSTRSSARALNVDSLVSFWWSTSRPVDLDDAPLRDPWNWNRSKEDTYSSSARFTGKYAPIRELLDYSYHRKYSQHRQKLQDDIIDSLMNHTEIIDTQGCHCARPQVPWVVFTAGAMGAGKSHVIKTLGERGYFPLNGFMIVDPDQIRRQLPEFLYYTQQYPEQAGALTRKEAGLIAEIAIEAGLERGYNIMVDGSLSNATWYERYIPNLRKQHPDLQVAILHVSAPREIVLERASVC